MATKKLPISELLFTAEDAVFDMSSYESVELFLEDVWHYVFGRWASRQSISVAAEWATLAEDQAEQFWRCHCSSMRQMNPLESQAIESRS